MASVLSLSGQNVDFDPQIHPILAARCLPCHSQEKRSGGLSLGNWHDTLDGGRSGGTITPGASATSLLMQRITGETTPRMPLGGDPLPAQEIALIRQWIDQGARATRTSEPAKREALISKLLADNERYAENWISFWNDLLRNDDSANYHSEMAGRKSITPWLFASLQTNRPYDQFV